MFMDRSRAFRHKIEVKWDPRFQNAWWTGHEF